MAHYEYDDAEQDMYDFLEACMEDDEECTESISAEKSTHALARFYSAQRRLKAERKQPLFAADNTPPASPPTQLDKLSKRQRKRLRRRFAAPLGSSTQTACRQITDESVCAPNTRSKAPFINIEKLRPQLYGIALVGEHVFRFLQEAYKRGKK